LLKRIEADVRERLHPVWRALELRARRSSACNTGAGTSGLISYIRVSRTRQGESGLELAAQHDAIARFAAGEGREVIAEFVEVKTGEADAPDRRPQLAAAVVAARKHRAAVAVCKLDRLSCDLHFISRLMAY
jgi:DNA invertase Pin-like site-specific DNA recombinase